MGWTGFRRLAVLMFCFVLFCVCVFPVSNGILFLINPISKKRMGSVLVAFASREDAETALSYHNKIYRDIIVNVSRTERNCP